MKIQLAVSVLMRSLTMQSKLVVDVTCTLLSQLRTHGLAGTTEQRLPLPRRRSGAALQARLLLTDCCYTMSHTLPTHEA